jgi:putative N6-adenine-specific DNA methylase
LTKYIAKTFQGLESVLESELHALGITDTEILNRSVSFSTDFKGMMLANLCLRTALRIYMPITEFEIENEQDLYNKVKAYDWSQHLSTDKTFVVESVVASKQFVNSHFIALKTKDAVVDYFYERERTRPSIDKRWPNLRLQVYISRTNHCVLSIDTTGEPLYKRGYKKRQTEASMNECLAAGLILMTRWKGEKDMYDMMSGSGTITAEALMIGSNFPPNLYREKWPFMEFDEFKLVDLKKTQASLKEKIVSPDVDFYVNEKNTEAYDIAKMNLFDLKVNTSRLQFSRDDFFEVTPEKPGILILNPPYDERLSVTEIELMYKDIGDMVKRHYLGFDVWIISSNKSAMRKIGLKDSKRFHVFNGGLECEFCLYEIY